MSLIKLLLIVIYWRSFDDKDQLSSLNPKKSLIVGLLQSVFLMMSFLCFVLWGFHHPFIANYVISSTAGLVLMILCFLIFKEKNTADKKNMLQFLLLATSSLVFCMIYYTGPMGVTLFIKDNVDKHLFGYPVGTQWLFDINALLIIIGAPLIASLFSRLRKKGIHFSIAHQFMGGLLLLSLSFFVLPIGILLSDSHGYSGILMSIIHFVLQSMGELCIAPVGYAMVGRLAPKRLKGFLMGVWMMISGLAVSLSHYFSNSMTTQNTRNPLLTNHDYAHVFNQLGAYALVSVLVLYLCTKQKGVSEILTKNISKDLNDLIDIKPPKVIH